MLSSLGRREDGLSKQNQEFQEFGRVQKKILELAEKRLRLAEVVATIRIDELCLTSMPQSGQVQFPVMYGDHHVICNLLDQDQQSTARYVELYQNITKQNSLIQKYYGIAEIPENSGRLWIVLENLEPSPSLNHCLVSREMAGFDLAKRLKMSYEIAKTIAYLHQCGCVVKNLSDFSIHLRKTSMGDREPVLTNLKDFRKVGAVAVFV